MARAALTVAVDGDTELRRALGDLAPAVEAAVKTANVALSSEIVKTAQRIAGGVGPQARRAASVLRAVRGGTAGGAELRPTSAVPFATSSAEFGSNQYRQFKRWHGAGADAGYFLNPAIRQVDVPERYADLLDVAVTDANGARNG